MIRLIALSRSSYSSKYFTAEGGRCADRATPTICTEQEIAIDSEVGFFFWPDNPILTIVPSLPALPPLIPAIQDSRARCTSLSRFVSAAAQLRRGPKAVTRETMGNQRHQQCKHRPRSCLLVHLRCRPPAPTPPAPIPPNRWPFRLCRRPCDHCWPLETKTGDLRS